MTRTRDNLDFVANLMRNEQDQGSMTKDSSELCSLSLAMAAQLIHKKKLSPVQLVDATFARVHRLNSRVNALITICEEQARSEAKEAESAIMNGRYLGPLHGIPITLKDNIMTHAVRTTAGARFFSPEHPQDADVTVRLTKGGAILIGKSNLHEFAFGVTTVNPHFGATLNPWNLERIAGGSSGGSAAAVALSMGLGSVGTDTGGSIRIPSALCGVVGVKPTYGRVSCAGVVPMSTSLDHVGPITRTVSDAAIMLREIAGYDTPKADTLNDLPPFSNEDLSDGIKGKTIGVPTNHFYEHIDESVRQALERSIRDFAALGATIKRLTIPDCERTVEPSTKIAFVEASRYHRKAGYFPFRAAEYGPDVREKLAAGMNISSSDYHSALQLQRAFSREMDAVFATVDALLVPATPITAPRLDQEEIEIDGVRESVRSCLTRMNRPANLSGHPAITLPCGFDGSGLPIGLQLIGSKWGESGLLHIAFAYEQATEWHVMMPPLS